MGGSWVLGYKGPWIEGQEDNSKVSGEVGVSLEGGWDEKKELGGAGTEECSAGRDA